MRLSKHRRAVVRLLLISLLGLEGLLFVIPVNAAPVFSHQSNNIQTSTTLATCTIQVDLTTDIIVDLIEVAGNSEASYTPSDTFLSSWATPLHSGGLHIFYAHPASTGTDVITITLSPNTVTVLSFCYDINSGVSSPVNFASASGTSMSPAVGAFDTYGSNGAVVNIMYTCCAATPYTAGSGFALNSASNPVSDGFTGSTQSEYGVISTPTTTCPSTITPSQHWEVFCIAFTDSGIPPPAPPIKSTTTTTITISSTQTVAPQYNPPTSLTDALANQLGFSITGLVPTLIIVGALTFLFIEAGFKDERVISFVMTLGFGICSFAGLIPIYIPIFIGVTLFLVMISGGVQKRVTG